LQKIFFRKKKNTNAFSKKSIVNAEFFIKNGKASGGKQSGRR
jgi:hypothetical protein